MIAPEGAFSMIRLALCSWRSGAVLGMRFKVQVLFPAAILGCSIVVAVALLKGSSMSSIIIAAIISVTSLQIGYLGGLLTRFYMAASRTRSNGSLRSSPVRSRSPVLPLEPRTPRPTSADEILEQARDDLARCKT